MSKLDKFVRDKVNAGAVLNTDNNALKAYKLKKEKSKEIDILKKEVSEIKGTLNKILSYLEKQ